MTKKKADKCEMSVENLTIVINDVVNLLRIIGKSQERSAETLDKIIPAASEILKDVTDPQALAVSAGLLMVTKGAKLKHERVGTHLNSLARAMEALVDPDVSTDEFRKIVTKEVANLKTSLV